MPLDALTVCALARELDRDLAGGRIDKINMPRAGELAFGLRTPSGTRRLLISAVQGAARVHVTEHKSQNPDRPMSLCVYLRKHIGGARLLSVSQRGGDRVLELTLHCVSELGAASEKRLIVELTGRHTNLILTEADGLILACYKPVGPDMSPRPVLPGLLYQDPPQDRLPLLEATRAQLEAICGAAEGDLCEYAVRRVGGAAPVVLAELAWRAGGDGTAFAGLLHETAQAARQGALAPYLVKADGAARDFTVLPMTHQQAWESVRMSGFSALLDAFFGQKAREDEKKRASADMTKTMQNVKNRLLRKLEAQRAEWAEAENRARLKHTADLILANLHAIKSGDERAEVVDYFSDGLERVTVTLDPELSAQQNAQRLYKRYARMKNAAEALSRQIESAQNELEYVDSVLFSLSDAREPGELDAIREELEAGGYGKKQGKPVKKAKPAGFAPLRFVTSDGFTVLCGRNNRENDELTLRRAGPHDVWLHARQAAGAHVLLLAEGKEPTARAIEEAAAVAAFHSRLASAPLAAVDYTRARHVKKPRGARAGMVNYVEYSTAFVVPADGVTAE